MSITKTRIFVISLVSCIIAVTIAVFITDNRAFEMYYWIPLFVYFLIQCYVFYLSRKTKIKKTWIIALINLIIALLLTLFFAGILLYGMGMRSAMGAMKG
ncbi:hypothetical protein [Flavobacterium sp.]|uniref:hypothetical protein n=1 Tax=Flavobacterium sp. TaxID=239 RepID=UPI00374D4197